MPQRPDWNRMGPRLPGWFRKKLKRIDPLLVPQFIPPTFVVGKDGANGEQFPNGVWAICRRIRQTGWLHRRWVLGLFDMHGNSCEPRIQDIHAIQQARDYWRRNKADDLDREFGDACERIRNADCDKSRDDALCGFADVMRKHDTDPIRRPADSCTGHAVGQLTSPLRGCGRGG